MARKNKKRPPADAGDPRNRRVTPADIQAKEFRESFRGYNEHEVDEFLDQVTEEVARLAAEVKRLQEQFEFRQTVPLGADAEEVLRRARDEAERIVAEARSRAAVLGRSAAGGTYGDGPPSLTAETADMINRYLGRERDFLRSLASTVQAHMESVKADTRAAREMAAGGSTSEVSGSEVPTPEGSASGSPASPAAEPGEMSDDAGGSDPDSEFEPATAEAESDEGRVFPSGPQDLGSDGAWSAGLPDETTAAGPPTMQWSDPPGDEPAASADSEHSENAAGAAGPRGSVGVRTGGRSEGVVHEMPSVPAPDDDAGEDRSLKELFWGED